MKVVYIGVFQTLNTSDKGYRCASTYDLKGIANMFTQGTAAQLMNLQIANACKTETIREAPADSLVTVKGEELKGEDADMQQDFSKYILYFRKRREGIVVCVITDKEYPSMVAQSLATRVAGDFCDRYPRSAYENMAKPAKDVDPFPVPEIKTYIVQYQDPSEADTITKIEKELDETKQVVINNINLVMERGAKLDSLVAKSEDINASSKLFYTQAKKQNSCCVVM